MQACQNPLNLQHTREVEQGHHLVLAGGKGGGVQACQCKGSITRGAWHGEVWGRAGRGGVVGSGGGGGCGTGRR